MQGKNDMLVLFAFARCASVFLTRSNTNRPIHPQKKARIWKFWVLVDGELHYRCSENKGAEILCSYCYFVFISKINVDKLFYAHVLSLRTVIFKRHFNLRYVRYS